MLMANTVCVGSYPPYPPCVYTIHANDNQSTYATSSSTPAGRVSRALRLSISTICLPSHLDATTAKDVVPPAKSGSGKLKLRQAKRVSIRLSIRAKLRQIVTYHWWYFFRIFLLSVI